jgi:hypothetical protein
MANQVTTTHIAEVVLTLCIDDRMVDGTLARYASPMWFQTLRIDDRMVDRTLARTSGMVVCMPYIVQVRWHGRWHVPCRRRSCTSSGALPSSGRTVPSASAVPLTMRTVLPTPQELASEPTASCRLPGVFAPSSDCTILH